jgi:cysteine desulfurase/selenocysteine lyase
MAETASFRIYLDNGATTWPKPAAVYDAVDRYQREIGAAAGRGAYREGATVDDALRRCRQGIARVLGGVDAKQVVFCFNGTDALNLAIHGVLRAGDHVVTSVIEHNSVLRPLRFLKERLGIDVAHVPCDAEGVLSADAVAAAMTDRTRLVAIAHVSNVTGAIQPIEAISQIARERGALILVDAAQSLGHLPTSFRDLPVDLVAAPGHKGLLGPLGTGVLYLRPGFEAELLPLRQGGTGTSSDEDVQPSTLPERYESGNHNVPGLVGLGAGVAYLQERTVAALREHEVELTAQLLDGLRAIKGVTLYGPTDPTRRVGVVSFNVEGYNPQELASLLDSAYGVQVRAGLHCAPLMHRALGTLAGGGTVRMSLGPFNTPTDIDQATTAVREIASVV